MYAVIETGGKQYRVSPGDHILVEKLPGEAGDSIVFDRVLLVVDDGEVHIGRPVVEGARVEGTLMRQTRGRKVIVFKFRPKQRYRRKKGHRQYYTEVRVERITMPEATATDTEEEG
ncbi:MAG: 50S ribosomal protein L21 [Chloroflexi bacterium]|nr:50S ribosomal protein L21 [Chloroflexota bacterium]